MSDYLDLRDLAAERTFLGAVWYSGGRALADTEITAEDFTHLPHELLWNAFLAMHADGAPFDVGAVGSALGAELPRVKDSLMEVITCGALPTSAEWHAKTLMRLTAHRRAVQVGERLKQYATGEADVEDLAEFARGQVDDAMSLRGGDPTETWGEQLDRAVERWQTPARDAIATGWHDLDELLSGGGLRPGHLTVIGARPGVGKSLVATMLAGLTAAGGYGVYFASAEMSADELVDRLAAAATSVSLSDLTNRTLSDGQVAQMRPAIDRIRRWPLTIDDRTSAVTHVLRGARTRTRAPGGLGLVIIDYLQLFEALNAGKAPRQEVVAGMSRAFKLMAKALGVPVVLLSQLNRASTQRENHRPLISDLRESGAVEQDADEIILLHRDEEDPDLAGQIQLIFAKNRHGRTGTVNLRWEPYISRISNLPTFGAGTRVPDVANRAIQTVNAGPDVGVGVPDGGDPVPAPAPNDRGPHSGMHAERTDLGGIAGSGVPRTIPAGDRYWPERDDDGHALPDTTHPDDLEPDDYPDDDDTGEEWTGDEPIF